MHLYLTFIKYMQIVINRTACCTKQTNQPHFYPPLPYRMTAHCSCTILLNSIAVMSAQVLYMWCLSTADPNYLNVALILRIQGIVKLNQGQPEVNDGLNYLGGSQQSFQKPAFNVAAVQLQLVDSILPPPCRCRVLFAFLSATKCFFFFMFF